MIAQLAGNYRAQWGEGPIWWDGKLYYVDIEGCRVVEFTPRSGEERSWDIGERVGSVVPRAGGGFVVAGDSGFAFFDPGTGQVRTLGDPERTSGITVSTMVSVRRMGAISRELSA